MKHKLARVGVGGRNPFGQAVRHARAGHLRSGLVQPARGTCRAGARGRQRLGGDGGARRGGDLQLRAAAHLLDKLAARCLVEANTHTRHTIRRHRQQQGSARRHGDDAPRRGRSAVVDPDQNLAAVLQIRDFDDRRQLHRLHRRGQRGRVRHLAIGRQPRMRRLHTGDAGRVQPVRLGRVEPMAARLIGFAQKIMRVRHQRGGRWPAVQAAGNGNQQRGPQCRKTHRLRRPKPPHCPAAPRRAHRNPMGCSVG